MDSKKDTILPINQRFQVFIKRLDSLWFVFNLLGSALSLYVTFGNIFYFTKLSQWVYKMVFVISITSDSLALIKKIQKVPNANKISLLWKLGRYEPSAYLFLGLIGLLNNFILIYGVSLPLMLRFIIATSQFIRKDILIFLDPTLQSELSQLKLNQTTPSLQTTKLYLTLQHFTLTYLPYLLKVNVLIELFVLPLSLGLSSLFSLSFLPILGYIAFLKLRTLASKPFQKLLSGILDTSLPAFKPLIRLF